MLNESFSLIIFGNKEEKYIKEFYSKHIDKPNIQIIGGQDQQSNIFSHFIQVVNTLKNITKKVEQNIDSVISQESEEINNEQ